MYIEVPNFGETEAKDAPSGGTFEAVPEGDYVVTIDSAAAATNSNGKPYIKVKMIIDSDAEGRDVEASGRFLFDNWYYSGKSLPYFKGKWSKTGAAWSDNGFDTDTLLGRKVLVQVRHEKYTKTDDNGAQTEAIAARVENYRVYVAPVKNKNGTTAARRS